MKKNYIIIIVFVILIAAIGFKLLTGKQSYTQNPTQSTVYSVKTDKNLGSFLTDTSGMTLYTFAKDTESVSNCIGNCTKTWPPYIATQHAKLLTGITIIKRSDGQLQYAYGMHPLYYYSGDTQAGDANGQGFDGLWRVAKK